jgi:hypothetical protein
MSFYIYRTHFVPTTLDNADLIVLSIYDKYFKKNGVIMTSFDMNYLLKKKWKRFESLEQIKISLALPKQKHQLDAIRSESMDQYWIDKKPLTMDFKVMGKISFSRAECTICKENHGVKIRLYNCKCVFHSKCIQQWVKYSTECPVCQCTIYKQLYKHKTCNEKENVPMLNVLV